jgi:hypothetical protein
MISGAGPVGGRQVRARSRSRCAEQAGQKSYFSAVRVQPAGGSAAAIVTGTGTRKSHRSQIIQVEVEIAILCELLGAVRSLSNPRESALCPTLSGG